MFLNKLTLAGFKNLSEQTVEFEPQTGVNIFLGSNGQGKTNFLEAVRLLALPKPLRAKNFSELLNYNQSLEYFRIIGGFVTEQKKDVFLEFGYQRKPEKRVYKVDNIASDLSHFVGNLQVVLFTPDDLNLLIGAPGLRRRFLDTLLSQVNPEYLHHLQSYYHALRQRNQLLKRGNVSIGEVQPWTQQLVANLVPLLAKRAELISYVQTKITGLYTDIAHADADVLLQYAPLGEYLDFENSDKQLEQEDIFKLFDQNFDRDLRMRHTTLGAHRSDFSFKLNGQPVATTASRGELRSLVLVLKLLELKFAEQQVSKRPLLLLDDVFSELDKDRRQQLLDLSANYQTLITTVEENYFKEQSVSRVYKMEAGKLSY